MIFGYYLVKKYIYKKDEKRAVNAVLLTHKFKHNIQKYSTMERINLRLVINAVFAVVLVVILTLFITKIANAQNLVPNPSFEEYQICPQYSTQDGSGHDLVPYWTYPTAGTTDYFNKCSSSIAGVPNNFAGSSAAKDGKGYIGFIAMGSQNAGFEHVREYAQAELYQRLAPGEKYCVSFFVKLASYSKYSVGEIGLYFSENSVSDNQSLKSIRSALNYQPHIKNKPNQKLDNKEQWTEICQIYTATGTEQFVVIGNFRPQNENIIEEVASNVQNKKGKEYAYYYIDDVKVIPVRGNCHLCSCIPHDLNADFTASHRTLTIEASGGKPPYSYEWSNGESGKSISKVKKGQYIYTVIDANGCDFTDTIDFVPPPVNLVVTHTSEYTGGNDGWIDLTVSGGKPPYTYTWSNGETTQDLTDLWEGEYTYIVTDDNGDEVTGTIIFKDKFKQELEQIEEGGKLTLKNIFFDFDKTELLPKSFIELDKLYEFIQEQDIRLVEISGHTDSKGNDEYNYKLSDARAKAVVDYLINRGIEKERLTSVGYGESQPIDTNSTDAGRANNRRVEFKILKK